MKSEKILEREIAKPKKENEVAFFVYAIKLNGRFTCVFKSPSRKQFLKAFE
jgi:hypothetical protein